MNSFQKIFALALALFAILALYFGSYLPFNKAQRYIIAISTGPSAQTLEEFERVYDNVFEFYSPVGSEETAKFFANDVVSLINQPNQSEAIARELVNYVEPKLFQNNVRHLMLGGQMYSSLWANYGRKAEDLKKAEDYYLKAFAIGPKLPPVLYGLLNFYMLENNQPKAKEIGGLILKYWPDDGQVRSVTDSPAPSTPR